MSDLLIIEFASEAKAEGVRETLLAMREEYLLELEDAAIAVTEANDCVKLNQLFRPAAPGAVSRMSWGSLIGLLCMTRSADPATGAAPPARSSQLSDLGIGDVFLKDAARTLRSGNVALLLLIRGRTTQKVVRALRGTGGVVLRSSFDETRPEALRAALAEARAAYAGAKTDAAR